MRPFLADKRAAAARVFRGGPLSVSLADHPVVAVVGTGDDTRQQALELATAMTLELTLACRPSDLSLLVVAAERGRGRRPPMPGPGRLSSRTRCPAPGGQGRSGPGS